jgi:hypothetical protein
MWQYITLLFESNSTFYKEGAMIIIKSKIINKVVSLTSNYQKEGSSKSSTL